MKNRRRRCAAIMAASAVLAGLVACTDETTSDPGTSAAETPSAEDPGESSEGADGAGPSEGSEGTGPSENPQPSDDDGDEAASGDWQTVEYGEFRFDLPDSWEARTQEVDGTEVPHPRYGRGFCPDSPDQVLGMVEITWAEGETDPVQAVTDEAQREVERYFSDRDATAEIGEVEHAGGWAAVPTTVELADSGDACDGDEALMVIKGAALEDGSGVVFLVVVGELGLEESPSSAALIEIANSFRGEEE